MTGDLADDSTQQQDDAIADAERFGMAAEEIEGLRQALGRRKGKLWVHHVNAFKALMAGATQWRHVLSIGAGGVTIERVIGLDYAGLKVALDALAIKLSPAEWGQLMILEAAAVGAKNGVPAPMLEAV